MMPHTGCASGHSLLQCHNVIPAIMSCDTHAVPLLHCVTITPLGVPTTV
jgi:hypothetical protein